MVKPRDQRVGMNGIAKFDCVANGNPPPSVFWTKEGSQDLMFAGTTHGQMHVTTDGTLTIHGVRKEDEGFYICSALSVVGSTVTKAYLDVTAIEDQPPPIIAIGPANQTLPINTIAILPCQASGQPKPSISWFKNGSPIRDSLSSRMTVKDSGTLVIDSKLDTFSQGTISQFFVLFTDLVGADTALYTCTASSESGETSWSASLSVEDPKNPNIMFHKTPDPATFPQPPTKPKIVDRRSTSVTLSWRQNVAIGQSQLIGYTVEYFSSDLETGWVTAAHRITSETYTVNNLKPDTSYVFLVRAENSHGMSPPSQVSERVRTLRLLTSSLDQSGDFSEDDLNGVPLEDVQNTLMNKVVELTSIEAISSTTIRVSWDVKSEAMPFIEGFYVRYRDMSGGSQKFNMKTVLNSHEEFSYDYELTQVTSSHVITSLKKFTEYEVFLMPFFKKFEGQPSNSLHVQTLEDVPSAPPSSVAVNEILNNTSALIQWSPPPPQHRNGRLLGYQIHIKDCNGSAFHSNITLNATTTQFALTNLTINQEYTVRAVAFTKLGLGPFSSPVSFKMDPSLIKKSYSDSGVIRSSADNELVSEPWFVGLLGSVIIVFVILIFASVILYRKHCSSQPKLKQANGYAAGQVGNLYDDMTARLNDSIWINNSTNDGSWGKAGFQPPSVTYSQPNHPQNDLYAEVNDPSLMTSFNNNHGSYNRDPAPYATTTLAMQNRNNLHVRQFSLVPAYPKWYLVKPRATSGEITERGNK